MLYIRCIDSTNPTGAPSMSKFAKFSLVSFFAVAVLAMVFIITIAALKQPTIGAMIDAVFVTACLTGLMAFVGCLIASE